MVTSSYKSILQRIAGYMGETLDDSNLPALGVEDAALANQCFNARYRLAHEGFFWPELMATERRQFRPGYDAATAYTVGDEVYYRPADKYYCCVQDGTGNAPATGDSYEVNSAYWAESQAEYDGELYDSATTYVLGDQVEDPDTGDFYQSLTDGNQGNTLDDTGSWGLLTAFERSIDLDQTGETAIGTVKAVWPRDPRLFTGLRPLKFILQNGRIIVRGCENVVWVEFRSRVPSFSGAVWASGNFSVGDQVYYTATGDYYKCIAAATTQAPSDTSKWEKVPVPFTFSEYLAQSVFADLQGKVDGQQEKFTLESAAGYGLLLQEIDKLQRQQGQARQLNVVC